MIKGCQKKLIVLKNPDSQIFEEVHFILRDKKAGIKDPPDIIKEAYRIISENSDQKKPQRNKKRIIPNLLWFACGAASAVGTYFCISLVTALIG